MPIYECTIQKQIKVNNEWKDSLLHYSGFFAQDLKGAMEKAIKEETNKNVEYGNSKTRYKLIEGSVTPYHQTIIE